MASARAKQIRSALIHAVSLPNILDGEDVAGADRGRPLTIGSSADAGALKQGDSDQWSFGSTSWNQLPSGSAKVKQFSDPSVPLKRSPRALSVRVAFRRSLV